ncbi:hypothetical protein M3Y97_00812700 [Aphelenchoides bicaudatus]|nr:hypothetical protein M3Y97_00812700 [Aphelenchoides bicaudatus]
MKMKESTFLWSIRGPNNQRPSFLFGTIHVAYDQVWSSVSSVVSKVLKYVDGLALELALHDPATVEKLIACKQLEADQSIQQLLPASLYQRLKRYFGEFRKPKRLELNSTTNNEHSMAQQSNALIGAWEHRRPVWLLFLLYQLGEEQLKQSSMPMFDAYLAQTGQLMGKQIYSIETPEEQCNPLLSIDQEQLIFAINYTLSYLEWSRRNPNRLSTKKSTIEELIQMYKCGNLKVTKMEGWRLHESGFTLNAELDEQAKKVDEQLKHDIIDQRNARMAMRVHELVKNWPERSFLFALGAGHFNGQYSLISILRNYGYIVEPVSNDTNIRHLFASGNNFKNFNELWIRKSNNKERPTEMNSFVNDQRHYYLWILLVAILLFIILIHRLSHSLLLRVNTLSKTSAYNQINVLPTYL